MLTCADECWSYQAHLGFDPVQVDTRDHFQGDGVLTRLHVVHLETEGKTFFGLFYGFIDSTAEEGDRKQGGREGERERERERERDMQQRDPGQESNPGQHMGRPLYQPS